jgi:hypothetical protein
VAMIEAVHTHGRYGSLGQQDRRSEEARG